MKFLVLALCALVTLVSLGRSLVITIRHYGSLPVEIPDHFDGYGRPDAYGPRPMIFAGVLAEIVIIAIWWGTIASSFGEPNWARVALTVSIPAGTAALMISGMQQQTVDVALGKSQRLSSPLRSAAIVIAAVLAGVGIGAFFH